MKTPNSFPLSNVMIANAEVAKVEHLLNARPRKSLGFRSPQGFFTPSLTLKFLCAGYLNRGGLFPPRNR